jgi:hypothetical protein
MSHQTQLLCTFVNIEALDATLQQIVENYTVVFDTIYILENVDSPSSLCCTYNIDVNAPIGANIPKTTISLHRKKATNTLYTINALNLLVAELNDGKIDKGFAVPWNEYKNTILVVAYDKLKEIKTRLDKIVRVSELTK